MLRVNLIAAVGENGQLGLGGKLPWPRDAEDLNFFRLATRKNIVVFGRVTFDGLFSLQPVWKDRMILCMTREHTMVWDAGQHIAFWKPGVDRILHHLGHKPLDLFVAGGAQIYELWMPYVRRSFITHVNYNGDADTWLQSLLGPRLSIN